MERQPQPRAKKKDRTGVYISIALHVLVVGLALYFVSKTQLGIDIMKRIGGEVVKKEKPKPPPAPPVQKGALKPPPGAPPPSGPRHVDAPPPVEGGFVMEERTKTKSEGGPARGQTNVVVVAPPPPVLKPQPRVFASAPAKSDIKQLLAERSKAAASVEAFGSEQIARSGVSDAGAVVTKIAGATVSEGKFAVIRGLNERYVSTTLNGANLPSADPYRQSAPLDLFPAQVIDKVVVTKTYTPDQEGSATGGGIDVVTKSFPERQFLTVSVGGEYNTQASLNDKFLTYKGGGLDWAGMDDGTRALPEELEKMPVGQQLPNAPVGSGSPIGGELYLNSVSNVAILEKVTKALGTTEFAPHREAPPLNHNLSIAGGGTAFLFGRPLGYFASGSYKHDYSFYEDGIQARYQQGDLPKSIYRDTRALSVVNWSTMVNMAYQPLDNHELGFAFFYNQNGIDDVRIQDEGKEFNQTLAGPYRKFNLYYTERNLNTYQWKGDHRFPDIGGLQFNWLVALTQTTQNEPDARFFNDAFNGTEFTTEVQLPAPSNPTRYFRNLDENNENIKLDWTLPFRNWREDEGQLKFGVFDSSSDRTFEERDYYYGTGDSTIPYTEDPNLFLIASNIGLASIHTNIVRGQARSLTFHWANFLQNFAPSLYTGNRDIEAGYIMLDTPVVPKLRFVGGVRYETTDLNVHSESYLDSSVTSQKTNDTKLSQADLLPSAGLIYSMTPKMNVRLNYSETIARPSFRELAAYYSYDTIINDFVEGNPLLQMTSIQNYDVRWEWFPRAGELLSVSVFYKDIKNAIERGNVKADGEVITFLNNDAKLYGIEFEARKTLDFLPDLKYFSIGANLSLLESEVKLSPKDLQAKRSNLPDADDTRPLYDQSPYILNLDLTYSNPNLGTVAGLVFNVAGPRIVITKLNTEDVYDQAVPVLDFIFSQRIGRHMAIKFSAKNLLDPEIERTYGKDKDSGLNPYSSYRRGRAFGISLTYEF